MKLFISLLVAMTLFATGQVSAQTRLLDNPPGAPSYTISNVRRERGRSGQEGVLFDYRKNREGYEDQIFITVRSSEGNFSLPATDPSSKDSGTLGFSRFMSIRKFDDIEIVLTQNYGTPDLNRHYYLVSNVLRVGNPKKDTRGESWTVEEEKAIVEYHRIMNDDLAHKFFQRFRITVRPTEGYELLPNNAIVTKTTPLRLCKSKKWHNVETLSQNDDGTINIKWRWLGIDRFFSVARSDLTVKSETLKALRRDPNIKFVSVKLNPSLPKPTLQLKNYRVNIPVENGWAMVPDSVDVSKGTPLKRCYRKEWIPLTCLGCNGDGTISVKDDDYPESDGYKMLRKELIVSISDLGGDAAKIAAAEVNIYAGLAKPLRSRRYKVSIPLPSDSQLVPKDTKLKPGTALHTCRGREWRPVTLVSNANDGTLNVSWDGRSSGFNCSIARNQLIIKTALLEDSPSLSQIPSTTPNDTSAEFRTWVDATGRFKVKAKLLSRTESSVTLLTENGDEKTLSIVKLSESDQKFLEENIDTENPFE